MQLTDAQIATTIARSHMAPSMRAVLARRVAAGEQEARFAVYGLYLRQIREDAKAAAAANPQRSRAYVEEKGT